MTENYIFYQIYPKSFCDSNGDGVGDIRGIISKIPYLKELGINAVWLSPCYQSPFVDNGYDISDYRKIDEIFGSTEDFDEMLSLFHANGIKLIMDFVANHTSIEHFWFQEARKSKDNPYREYYIWRKTPPNDWQSVFGGSAWQYDAMTDEYYLHSFAVEQPDLNWENEKVRQEMRSVVEFWAKKGVDGFRCDVLDMIAKDFEKGWNGNGEKLHGYIQELFLGLDLFTVGECWSTNEENLEKFCSPKRRELTTVFCFEHLRMDGGRFAMQKPPLKEVCKSISGWQVLNERLKILPTLFLENHDQPRAVSRFADENAYRFASATMLGGLVLLHRGIPFLYQGQEIGMTNFKGEAWEQFNDVESRFYYQSNHEKIGKEETLKRINYGGRDNARTMMPWTEEEVKSWQSPYDRREEINVRKDKNATPSIFQFFKRLIALRKGERALTKGSYRQVELDDEGYTFQRNFDGEEMMVFASFERGKAFRIPQNYTILLDNYENNFNEYQPYRLVVVKKTKGAGTS